MMTPIKLVTAEDRIYRVVEDRSFHYLVFARGRAVDEISGQPLQQSLAMSTDVAAVKSITGRDGLYGIAGYPELIAASLPTVINIELHALRYRVTKLAIPVPNPPVYPINLGDTPLRELSVRIQGRITDDATRAPIAGASIISDVATAAILRTPLHVAHASGVTVRRRALPPSGAARHLAAPAQHATKIVTLDSTAGLAASALLRFGNDENADFAVIDTVLPANQVSLFTPLARSFPTGAIVQRHNRGAIGATSTLARSADEGDGVLTFAASLTPNTFELLDGNDTEYGYGSVLSDVQGDYRIDGVCGVATLTLKASSGLGTKQQLVPVAYDQAVTFLDFRL